LFEWEDSLSVNATNLQFLGQLNLQAAIRKDVNGCDVVDRPTLLSMLASARQALFAQGSVATSAQNDQLNAETTYVLESCAIENHRRQIAFSVAGSFESWRRLLDLSLTKCFDRLPHDRRENMLFDLLHVLPAAIRSQSIEEPTAVLLSECTLSLITKLREDRRYQLILQSTGTHESASLPAERLNSILQTIIEGILDSNHSELIRGNLYGTLINFIHLILTTNDHAMTTDDSISEFGATVNPYSVVVLGHTGNAPGVELGVLASLKPVLERIVAIIARDAIDGTEVWKTVAFMLLDAVVQLSSLEKSHSVLGALERHGILHNFVSGLKDSDPLLQSILKPDPGAQHLNLVRFIR
jgi:nuclear pore complex protein Nup205